jgi:hypothetical protein
MTPLLGDDSIFLGILQLTAASPPCVSCDGVTPPRVPGPATLVLLGTGLLALIAARRLFRRR